MFVNRIVLSLLVTTSTFALAGTSLTTLTKGLNTLALTAGLASLAVAGGADLIKDELLWERVTSKSPVAHRTAFLLEIELATHQREMPLVMVGRDSLGQHLFVGARIHILNLPIANQRVILDEALSVSLYAHDGLVDGDFIVKEIATFDRPGDSLARIYDLSVLTIETATVNALNDYPIAKPADFPALMTPLDIVVYHPGGRSWRAYHRRCRIRRHIDNWLATNDCVVPFFENRFVDMGATLFINSTDKFAGVQLEPDNVELPVMIPVPKDLQVFLDAELSINSGERLPTTWGEIKREAQQY